MHVQYCVCACACADRCPWRACTQFKTIRRGLTLGDDDDDDQETEREQKNKLHAYSVYGRVPYMCEQNGSAMTDTLCTCVCAESCTRRLRTRRFSERRTNEPANGVERTQHQQQHNIIRLLCASCFLFFLLVLSCFRCYTLLLNISPS